MKSLSYILFLVNLLILIACSDSAKTSETDSTETLSMDTTEQLPDKDTVAVKEEIKRDEFQELISTAKDSLESWGFQLEKDEIMTPENYKYHWYLKHYTRPSHHARDTMPSREMLELFKVRQAVFKKQWKFIIEEWEFPSRDDAENWIYIINRNYRMDDQKPPREMWLENNRIYFVVATAAQDWFGHGDQLVSLLTDRDPYLIRLLYNPMDIVRFKRTKGGSNSGNHGSKHFFKPSAEGIHYYYSLFRTPMHIPEYKRLGGLVVQTYIYRKVAGDYFDEDEILLGIYANYYDRDLGKMNWVEKPLNTVKEQLGNPQYESNDRIAYYHAHRMLSFRIENDFVADFRFRITDTNLESGSFPGYLD